MKYCTNCGIEVREGARFCASCGHPLQEDSPAPEQEGRPSVEELNPSQEEESELRYKIPLPRVVIMSILSSGFYMFYWLFLTWKQYRDHTGEKAFPVWHALTFVVPVYQFFRFHAHVRVYKELMEKQGLRMTISPGQAVGLSFSMTALYTLSMSVSPVLAGVIYSAVLVLLLTRIQPNLNNYWDHVAPARSYNAGIGVGEVVFAVLGGLFWLSSF